MAARTGLWFEIRESGIWVGWVVVSDSKVTGATPSLRSWVGCDYAELHRKVQEIKAEIMVCGMHSVRFTESEIRFKHEREGLD